MDPRHLFADQRFACCVYCGGEPSTADHVPSKVLLDEPYPDNLPVVQACVACNNRLSADEAYLACLVECALTGSVSPNSVHRPKVKRILTKRPALRSLIKSCRVKDESGAIFWEADVDRVRNVVLKLARGHTAYECSEPRLEEPERICFAPMTTLTAEQVQSFEKPLPVGRRWPEIGSRAFHRAVMGFPTATSNERWQVVQPGRYRYLVSPSGRLVKLMLSEYIACEVSWED